MPAIYFCVLNINDLIDKNRSSKERTPHPAQFPIAVIERIIKGQAGQAIQCLNIMMGWDETLGLPKLGFYP